MRLPRLALSLTQPWATLVAIGAKRIETRSWSTTARGMIAIHAAKKFPRTAQDLVVQEPFRSVLGSRELPTGAIVGLAEIAACWRFPYRGDPFGDDIEPALHEAVFGDFTPGRFGFYLPFARTLSPIPCSGALGFWRLPVPVAIEIERQLRAEPAAAWLRAERVS